MKVGANKIGSILGAKRGNTRCSGKIKFKNENVLKLHCTRRGRELLRRFKAQLWASIDEKPSSRDIKRTSTIS